MILCAEPTALASGLDFGSSFGLENVICGHYAFL
jgi:hypothetical protein